MRTIRHPIIPFALLALLLAGTPARASEPAHAVTMAALPGEVRALLVRREGEIADAGEPFSEGCVRRSGTAHARLISAEMRPDTVLVRYERGGIAGARAHEATFTKEGDSWIEVVQHTRLTWPGRPRAFGAVAGKAAPPPGKPSDP